MSWLNEDERISRWVAMELEGGLRVFVEALKHRQRPMPTGLIVKRVQRAVMALEGGLTLEAFKTLAHMVGAELIMVTGYENDSIFWLLAKTSQEEVVIRIPYKEGGDTLEIGNPEVDFKSNDERFRGIFNV